MPASPSVISRVASILRTLAQHEPDGISTTVLAQEVGIPRPTAHRLLASLAREGITDRDSEGRRWKLGPEAYLLGAAAAPRYDIGEVARPTVHRLAEATAESAFFSMRRGDETVCLVREDGSFPIRSFVLYEGVRFPLGIASAGLVMLAHLPEEERRAYLDRAELDRSFGEAHGRRELERRIHATRRDGYAVNPGLIVEGSWGMAAAVFDDADRPRWALSLTGIDRRFAPDRRPRLGALLLSEAHRLGKELSRRDR